MTHPFKVEVVRFSNLLEIDGARKPGDYGALLDAMDFGDRSGLSDDELREMCVMSLQDLKPEDAAYAVLKHDMSDVLREGQVRNLSHEMLDEKLWEEYPDSSLHERFFTAGSLLYAAFPRSFPKPDAVQVTLKVTAANDSAQALLTSSPDESFLVRLLADGMDERAILRRLYDDELKGDSFPNAAEIVWIVRTETGSDGGLQIDVIGSGNWLDALDGVSAYDSSAYADGQIE